MLTSIPQGEVVELLLEAGANVNARQSTGHTPLQCCAMKGQADMMRALLNARADPTLGSVEGQTPLHTAAQVTSKIVAFVAGLLFCATPVRYAAVQVLDTCLDKHHTSACDTLEY